MRRSRLLAWLLRDRDRQPSWRSVHAQSLVLLNRDLRALEEQVAWLRASQEQSAAAAVSAELRAERLERELASVRAELSAVRADLTGVREELLWGFAERKLAVDAPRVVDLTRPVAGTA